MSTFSVSFGEIWEAAGAGCHRLVNPGVESSDERSLQARLLGFLFAAPFPLAASLWLMLQQAAGIAPTLAFVCASFGVAWMGAVAIAATGRTAPAMQAVLMAAAVEVAVLIGAGGGLSSPAAALALALPVEAWLLYRSRRSLLWGGLAALLALASQPAGAAALFPAATVAAWHWLAPIIYAATLLPRLAGLVADRREQIDQASFPPLESVVDAVVLRFAQNGDVVEASHAARRLLGLAPDLLLGAALFDRIHVADRVGYLCALADLRDGALTRSVEIRIRLPQGDERGLRDTYAAFAVEMMKPAPEAPFVTGLVRDNRMVADLRRSLVAAEEVNDRLELAKGRFLAAVSHELRTPLNSIIGFSDMLLHEMFGAFRDPRQKEYIELVRDSGHHLLDVVNAILDVSKIEAGSYMTNPEPFRLREAVEMCSSMMSVQAAAKAIRMTTAVSSEIGEVRADRRAIQQVLINLVSNALKFTPNGGVVAIGAKRVGSRIHFWVSDSGIGIAEADLERLGRPFTQVQNDYTRQFEGTGLGLSLVKGLVALHDGTMSIDSALGDGTTVTITLPVDGPGPASAGGGAEPLDLKMATRKEALDGTLRKAG